MVRANGLPDGITAPMCSGFSINERKKRTSSSRRGGFFNARTDCNGMGIVPDGTADLSGGVRKGSQTRIGRGRNGQAEPSGQPDHEPCALPSTSCACCIFVKRGPAACQLLTPLPEK